MQRDSSGDEVAGSARPKRTRSFSLKYVLGWLGLTAVLAGAGVAAGYLIAILVVFPSRDQGAEPVTVPALAGVKSEQARETLEAIGLAYQEAAGFHHSAAEGTVLAQEPLAGQEAPPGSAVEVALSLGPRLSPVPSVIGLRHLQAEIVLGRAGYSSERAWIDSEADVGEVVDTRPAPGTPLRVPGQVQLMISAGAPNVRVPELITRSLAEAELALERLGLRLGTVREDSSALAAPGTVLAQSPGAGTTVARATRVRVTVASEPPVEEPVDTAGRQNGI